MNQNIKKVVFLTLLLVIITIILTDSREIYEAQRSYSSQSQKSEYVLAIKDSRLYLFENEQIVKEYDVNISVLPPEDILLLSEGIRVDSLSEADETAENFDG